jgi:hypothetical protein
MQEGARAMDAIFPAEPKAFGPVEVLPAVACIDAFRSTAVASDHDPVLYRSDHAARPATSLRYLGSFAASKQRPPASNGWKKKADSSATLWPETSGSNAPTPSHRPPHPGDRPMLTGVSPLGPSPHAGKQ